MTRGFGTAYTVNITPTGGFSNAIVFTASGLPFGVLGIFSPNPSTGASTTFMIWTSSSAPAGTYPFTITGTSGSLSHSTPATLILN